MPAAFDEQTGVGVFRGQRLPSLGDLVAVSQIGSDAPRLARAR
jgi:hypothetical protein